MGGTGAIERRRAPAAAPFVSFRAPEKRGAMRRHENEMRRALALAERGWGRVSPNPLVGAVIVAVDGTVAGEGWHEGPGTPHAEVMALAQAGEAARGATVVTSLEPCNHVGRTPPCTRALIAAGVARVVVGATDPNLDGDAPGVRELREAGIEVQAGVLEAEARRLNEAFERHVRTGRPFVVLKSAATLDGRTAAADGTSRWITSEDARADAQRLRAWADAIVAGAGTVLADDPSLTVRDARYADARPPVRVIVDAAGAVPSDRAVFDHAAPTLVATTARAPEERLRAWQVAGADVAVLDADAHGGVALGDLLDQLGKRDVQGALVEGGATLAWSFVREDLVDRVVLYLAPKLLGGDRGHGVLDGAGFAPVGAARGLEFERVERIGPDLKVEARVHRDR
ncbi:MAG: bifunctional diaminohydroxyphosphoribosylaminopyrimidine deaminase/5-amino-6-(5-phosphoribosylamino)uracil reductase RibD [Planctomycetaceae bacterium]